MSWNPEHEKELTEIIDRFSLFIRTHIQSFRVAKLGVDAEDIAQEVRIKLWKIIRSEKKIHNPSSYIRKVVDTSVIDHVRKFKRDEGILLNEKAKRIAETVNSYVSSPNLDGVDPREIIGQAVERLLDSRRTVVRLYLMNMSIEEIAKTCHWSPNRTRNLLYRGLADLKKILKGTESNHVRR